MWACGHVGAGRFSCSLRFSWLASPGLGPLIYGLQMSWVNSDLDPSIFFVPSAR